MDYIDNDNVDATMLNPSKSRADFECVFLGNLFDTFNVGSHSRILPKAKTVPWLTSVCVISNNRSIDL